MMCTRSVGPVPPPRLPRLQEIPLQAYSGLSREGMTSLQLAAGGPKAGSRRIATTNLSNLIFAADENMGVLFFSF